METYDWYAQLAKPEWAPPAWLFGPVWSVLHVGIAISFGTVFIMAAKQKIPFAAAAPFIINLAANAAFTPLQFGLRNNVLALLDILVVLGTIVWGMVAIWKHAKWIAYAQIPYLLWVSFATVLQTTITWMNA